MNHKFFVLFCLYTTLCGLISISLITRSFIHCGAPQHSSPSERDAGIHPHYPFPGCDQFYSGEGMALLMLTCLFTLFTSCMLVDQWDAVWTGVSKIDQMQSRRQKEQTEEAERVRRVVNERNGDSPEVPSSSPPNNNTNSLVEPPNQDFNEIFGGSGTGIRLDWFLPTAVVFRRDAIDQVRGYVMVKTASSTEGGVDEGGDEGGDIEQGGSSAISLSQIHVNTLTSSSTPSNADEIDDESGSGAGGGGETEKDGLLNRSNGTRINAKT
jgi:hypothetical protein